LVEDVQDLQILLAVAQVVVPVAAVAAPQVLVDLQLQIKASQADQQNILVLQILLQLAAAVVQALQVEMVLSLAVFWEVQVEAGKVLT
jgi:secreted protein with Ig-like and vWFA domain